MKQLFTISAVLFLGLLELNAQVQEIPFELKNDIILIELQLNEQEHRHTFIFDTGASSDVLDIEVAKNLVSLINSTDFTLLFFHLITD